MRTIRRWERINHGWRRAQLHKAKYPRLIFISRSAFRRFYSFLYFHSAVNGKVSREALTANGKTTNFTFNCARRVQLITINQYFGPLFPPFSTLVNLCEIYFQFLTSIEEMEYRRRLLDILHVENVSMYVNFMISFLLHRKYDALTTFVRTTCLPVLFFFFFYTHREFIWKR